jgi:D-glycero-alpha-D-manno-heptose-7-phosphate kinase
LRLDFAGGWTDVPPFSADVGGSVVNAALGLFARVRWEPGGQTVRVRSRDLGASREAPTAADLSGGGSLDLVSAVARRLDVPRGSIETESEAPPGSGLGSSGALGVALVLALRAARGERVTPAEAAETAWAIETGDAGIPGGRQDQYAAALGGVHLMRFRDPAVEVHPLAPPPGVMEALASRLVLCYTGTSRVSGRMISRVVEGWTSRRDHVVRAMHGMAEVGERMAEAFRRGSLADIGRLLSTNWSHQQALDSGMRTGPMAALEHMMRDAGALGGKAAGAGAGGCMFFLAPDDPGPLVAAARRAGVRILPVTWSMEGAVSADS